MTLTALTALSGCSATGEAPAAGETRRLLSVEPGENAFAIDRLDAVPDFTLFTDGQLFIRGPIDESALLGMRLAQLPPSELDEIIRLLDRTSLLQAPPEPAGGVPFDGATEFTWYDDTGEAHRILVPTVGAGRSDATLLNEVAELLQTATDGPSEEYVGERIQVLAGYHGTSIEELVTRAEWPFELQFDQMDEWATLLRCGVLEGFDATVAAPILANADQRYLWGPDEHGMLARPLLPDEEGCAPAPAEMRNMPPPTFPPTTTSQ